MPEISKCSPSDLAWDLAFTNPQISKSRLYRCSAADRGSLPRECTVVDLRTQKEKGEGDRSGPLIVALPLSLAECGNAYWSRMEVSYLEWVDSGEQIFPIVLEAIREKHSIAISCVQGIDRTGFVCGALHLALGTLPEAIRSEYLSRGDTNTKLNHIDLCLAEIDRRGGIESYLEQCGCTPESVSNLRLKLLR